MFEIECLFLVPLIFVYCLYDAFSPFIMCTIDGISVLGMEKKSEGAISGFKADEEGFQIHIQS